MRSPLAGRRSSSSFGEGSRGAGEHRYRGLRLGALRVRDLGQAQEGKLELPLPPREWLAQAFAAYSLRELPITLQIAALAPEVAVAHADPCDRMIVATAQLHGIPVMTSDHLISVCKHIEIVW
jgi:predicted nucleic acid-binding protein